MDVLMTLSVTQNTLTKVWRFSQRCDWTLHSPEMWCCITIYQV